jgi:ribosomal-protein-alanine N-acetyltransferase
MRLPEPSLQAVYTILPATWRDLNALRRLERICFPNDYWPLLDLIGVLTFPNIIRFKAEVGDEMAGFSAAERRKGEDLGWIATIGVLPEYRRRGIATALLETSEKSLNVARIRLNVRASNHEAICLYRHLGFQEVSLWPAYYLDKEDALVLEKQIRP